MNEPPSKASGLRAKADECHQLAMRSTAAEDKARWLDLATGYLKLAQGLEERDRKSEAATVVEFPSRPKD